MKAFNLCVSILAVVVVGTLTGCSTTSTRAANVIDSIRTSLDQAGLKDVSASQDRDKGVVTLGGHVSSDRDKTQAESIARSLAGSQVVANQVAVIPPGVEREAKTVNSDLDKGIESNLDAALIMDKLHDSVKYAVKNHVVTLTGDVDSPSKRARAEEVASAVPNVQQVVNVLQVKGQKATSSVKSGAIARREICLDTRPLLLTFGFSDSVQRWRRLIHLHWSVVFVLTL
jgi:osmotically-inducible protein OsmY